jgi:hypothetical protein
MTVYRKNNKSRTMKNSSKAVSKKSRKQKHRSKKTRKNIKNGGGKDGMRRLWRLILKKNKNI